MTERVRMLAHINKLEADVEAYQDAMKEHVPECRDMQPAHLEGLLRRLSEEKAQALRQLVAEQVKVAQFQRASGCVDGDTLASNIWEVRKTLEPGEWSHNPGEGLLDGARAVVAEKDQALARALKAEEIAEVWLLLRKAEQDHRAFLDKYDETPRGRLFSKTWYDRQLIAKLRSIEGHKKRLAVLGVVL